MFTKIQSRQQILDIRKKINNGFLKRWSKNSSVPVKNSCEEVPLPTPLVRKATVVNDLIRHGAKYLQAKKSLNVVKYPLIKDAVTPRNMSSTVTNKNISKTNYPYQNLPKSHEDQFNIVKQTFQPTQCLSIDNSPLTFKVIQKIKKLKTQREILKSADSDNNSVTAHTAHKIKSLKKNSKGGLLLQIVDNNTPENIKKPHNHALAPVMYEMKKSQLDVVKDEIIRPNRGVFISSLALIFGVFIVSSYSGVSNFTSSVIPQSFAKEDVTVKNEIEKVKEFSSLSPKELVQAHKEILSENKPSLQPSNYILPTPDVKKPAFIQIKDLGIDIDFDLENKKPDPSIYYYDFAGKPGSNQKTYILSVNEKLSKKLSDITPSTKIVIRGNDDSGNNYRWNYTMVSKNTFDATDPSIFDTKARANFAIIIPSKEGTVEVVEARLVNVDKAD